MSDLASREVRGVWVASHHHSSVLKSADSIARALDVVLAHGLNTVFPAVWNRGLTAFPSQVMQRYGYPLQDPEYLGFDPLGAIVEQGRQRGLAVIPWLEYGFASSPDPGGGHLLAARPEWAALDRAGHPVTHGGLSWMNGLHPGVQQLLLDLSLEMIQVYDVDGIQADDRLPALPFNGGYDPDTIAAYRAVFGQPPPADGKDSRWIRFRCDRLTAYLERLHLAVKSAKPSGVVSLAPAPFPFGRDNLMQDSDRWLRQGLVDLLHPQIYRNNLASYRRSLDQLLGGLSATQRRRISPGIAFTANQISLTADTIVAMVTLNRERGLGGECFFFYEGLLANDHQLAVALSSRAGYGVRASPPPPLSIA